MLPQFCWMHQSQEEPGSVRLGSYFFPGSTPTNWMDLRRSLSSFLSESDQWLQHKHRTCLSHLTDQWGVTLLHKYVQQKNQLKFKIIIVYIEYFLKLYRKLRCCETRSTCLVQDSRSSIKLFKLLHFLLWYLSYILIYTHIYMYKMQYKYKNIRISILQQL